jgi:hypothetical protein
MKKKMMKQKKKEEKEDRRTGKQSEEEAALMEEDAASSSLLKVACGSEDGSCFQQCWCECHDDGMEGWLCVALHDAHWPAMYRGPMTRDFLSSWSNRCCRWWCRPSPSPRARVDTAHTEPARTGQKKERAVGKGCDWTTPTIKGCDWTTPTMQ